MPHYNLRQTLLKFASTYKYFKMCRLDLLQNAAPFSHNAHIIIKCRNRYYKMRNL